MTFNIFPGLSRNLRFNFQDKSEFTGLSSSWNLQEKSRSFEEAWKPCETGMVYRSLVQCRCLFLTCTTNNTGRNASTKLNKQHSTQISLTEKSQNQYQTDLQLQNSAQGRSQKFVLGGIKFFGGYKTVE